MAAVKSVEIDVVGERDLALIDIEDGVWLVVPLRWADLATLIWWFLTPSDKKANIKLNFHGGQKSVSVKAIRVATRHARLRGRVK